MSRQGFHVFAIFNNQRYPLIELDISELITMSPNTKLCLWDEDKEEYLEVSKKELSDFEVYQYLKDG